MLEAFPISDRASVSQLCDNIFKKEEKKMLCKSRQKRRLRLCKRNNSGDTKASEKGGGGGALCTRAEIQMQSLVKTMVSAGYPPAAQGGPWWSRYPTAAHGGPHTGAGGCRKEAVTLWRAYAGAGSCQDHEEEPTL